MDGIVTELERVIAEQRRAIDEQTRRAEEYRISLEREAQARRDAEAAAIHFQRELAEARRSQQEQVLETYLAQTSRMYRHLSRLIPPAATSQAPAPTAGAFPASSTKTSTVGQTKIHGKYYPLSLRPWTDFPELHGAAFARIRAALGDRHTLPSPMQVQANEETLLDELPVQFLQTALFYNAARTTVFLGTALQGPASKILRQYFAATGVDTCIFFDNKTAGVASSVSTSSVRQEESAVAGSGPSSASTDTPKLPTKTLPDCVVLTMTAAAAGQTDDISPPKTRRIAVGEHKSCHALRALDIAGNPALAEDYLVRLAIAAKARQRKKKGLGPTVVLDRSPPVFTDANFVPKASSKESFFASALAQTYHYMLFSGLEFGFLASGETLSFLRIPEDDPTTLLYHTSLFPATPPEQLPRQDDGTPLYPGPATGSSSSSNGDPADDEALSALAISEICGLCLLAFDSPARSPAWIANAILQMAAFPNLPPRLLSRDASPSSLGVRQRDDDDSSNDDNDDDDDSNSEGRRRRLAVSGRHNVSVPSPLKQSQSTADHGAQHKAAGATTFGTHDRVNVSMIWDRNAILEYCTQACLLGLARGQMLDPRCPNYILHKQGQNKQPHLQGRRQGQRHPITQAQLAELFRAQLRRHPEENCECLYDAGHRGAIGCLLKVTLTGYGYTFVAKGVEAWNARRLRRETRIYTALRPVQGELIPVHLGLVKLIVPYPLIARFAALTHMMLMSYAGISLHYGERLTRLSERLGRDLEHEIESTYAELSGWGLDDRDERMCNATWCEEKQRVMKIDFDHASLDAEACAQKARERALERTEVAELPALPALPALQPLSSSLPTQLIVLPSLPMSRKRDASSSLAATLDLALYRSQPSGGNDGTTTGQTVKRLKQLGSDTDLVESLLLAQNQLHETDRWDKP